MIERGSLHWMDFGPPVGSRPAKRRPAVVVQSDHFNRTRLGTVLVVSLTTNLESATRPGNVFVPAGLSGVPHDSVINVSSLASVGRFELEDAFGVLPLVVMKEVDAGLRLVLDL